MDRYQAMRLRRGDRVTFSEGGTPGHLSHKLNKGTVVEVSRPDAGRGRKGGGILVEVDTRLKEWIPYFRVVKVRRPEATAQQLSTTPPDLDNITDF